MHSFTIYELIKLEESHQKKSIKSLIRTVIMRYQGIHTEEIQHMLGKSRLAITGYINKWNKYSLDALTDNRGGSISTLLMKYTREFKRYSA